MNGGSRKGCLWGLNPAKADKMDEEITKWIKRASKANGTVNGGKVVLPVFRVCLLPLYVYTILHVSAEMIYHVIGLQGTIQIMYYYY